MTVAPPLAGPVSTMLPSGSATRLLRGALWAPEAAREELLAWQEESRSPPAERLAAEGRLLAPLLAARIGERSAGLEGDLVTYLRMALVREEWRGTEYRKILAGVAGAVAEAGIPLLVLEGAALGESVYPRPELRHSHGISSMIREGSREAVETPLRKAGFRITGGLDPGAGVLLRAVHQRGLPLTLRFAPLPFPGFNGTAAELWDRARQDVLAGSPALVLAPADQLWHVCARAATGQRRGTHLWACDAYHLVTRGSKVDWDAFVDHAERTRVSLSLWALLRYLTDELSLEVPPAAIDRLAVQARLADRTARELALTGAAWRPGPKLLPLIRATRSWHERAIVARWRLLPSVETLRGSGRIGRAVEAPLFIVSWPLRSLFARSRVLLRRSRPTRGFTPPPRPDATSEPRS